MFRFLLCFPGEFRRSLYAAGLGPAETASLTGIQTARARSEIRQHQHTRHADVLHTKFALRRSGSGRLFFRRERIGTVAERRQSAERNRKVK